MKQIVVRILCIVVGIVILMTSITMPVVHASKSSVDLIVQARSKAGPAKLADGTSQHDGETTRDLHIINALAVRAPAHTVYRLERSPSFA